MSDLYSGLGSFVQPRRMQEGGQALTDLQKNVLAEYGFTPEEAQNAVRMIIAGQGDMLAPKFKELSGTGYFRRVGEAFNMVDAAGNPITLGGSTAVAGIDFPGQTIEYGPSAEKLAEMQALKEAAEQNYTFGTRPPGDTPPAGTPPGDTPPAGTPPGDTPPADTPPPAGYQRFNLMSYFGQDAAPINFSSSFENVFGPAPVNPGQDSPDFGFFQIDTKNYDRARNVWNSMSPSQRAATTDADGTPVNNFIIRYGQDVGSDAVSGFPGAPGGGTTQGSNTLPDAGTVVGDLFPDPGKRVIPTMDMVRQQSLEGPMLSGAPPVYQLPTQGTMAQRQDPFARNVKQTTRPLDIPERIIPALPEGGVTN